MRRPTSQTHPIIPQQPDDANKTGLYRSGFLYGQPLKIYTFPTHHGKMPIGKEVTWNEKNHKRDDNEISTVFD